MKKLRQALPVISDLGFWMLPLCLRGVSASVSWNFGPADSGPMDFPAVPRALSGFWATLGLWFAGRTGARWCSLDFAGNQARCASRRIKQGHPLPLAQRRYSGRGCHRGSNSPTGRQARDGAPSQPVRLSRHFWMWLCTVANETRGTHAGSRRQH